MVYVRPSIDIELLRRLQTAGACMERPLTPQAYARMLILAWLAAPTPIPLIEKEGETTEVQFPLPDAKELELRAAAAARRTSHGVLAYWILAALCPHRVEALAAALEK